jgi:broad specificity phosphatase PhoE
MKKKNIKKKIWFIRHGQSLANADANFKSDDFSAGSVSLSEKGMKQAEELLKHFSDAPDLLITSPYVRTKETAKPLLNKYPNIPQEEWSIHEFTYFSGKRCFNTTFLEREPWKDNYWQESNPEYNDGDGAESFIDFMDRTREAIEMIKKRKENFIVLFSHQYTIVAVRYILEKNPKKITSEVMRDFKKYFKANPVPNAEKVEILIK